MGLRKSNFLFNYVDLWCPSICFHRCNHSDMLGPQTSPVETCAHPECMTSLNSANQPQCFCIWCFFVVSFWSLQKKSYHLTEVQKVSSSKNTFSKEKLMCARASSSFNRWSGNWPIEQTYFTAPRNVGNQWTINLSKISWHIKITPDPMLTSNRSKRVYDT